MEISVSASSRRIAAVNLELGTTDVEVMRKAANTGKYVARSELRKQGEKHVVDVLFSSSTAAKKFLKSLGAEAELTKDCDLYRDYESHITDTQAMLARIQEALGVAYKAVSSGGRIIVPKKLPELHIVRSLLYAEDNAIKHLDAVGIKAQKVHHVAD